MNIEELAIMLKLLGYNFGLSKEYKSKQYKRIYLAVKEPILEIEELLKQHPNFSFDYRYKFPSNWMWICEGELKKNKLKISKPTWEK